MDIPLLRRNRRRVPLLTLLLGFVALTVVVAALFRQETETKISSGFAVKRARCEGGDYLQMLQNDVESGYLYLRGGAAAKPKPKAAKKKAPSKSSKAAKPEKKKKPKLDPEAEKERKKKLAEKKKKEEKKKKNADKPRRPKSAFLCFLDKLRQDNKSKGKQVEAKDFISNGGKMWQEMTDAQKAPFEKISNKLKVEYTKELAAYQEKQSHTKAAKKPKRPLSAFMQFMNEFRNANDGKYSLTEMSKAGGEQWQSLNDKQKQKYNDLANSAKKKYDKDLESWSKLPDDE